MMTAATEFLAPDFRSRDKTPATAKTSLRHLSVRLAQNQAEILAAQRLRFQVFFREMGAKPPNTEAARREIDSDELDCYCEHLIVVDNYNNQIVGTYRILSPRQAALYGSWYSASEFDLSAIKGLANSLVEVGRSCVHRDYRNGATIARLWSGLVKYMKENRYQYLAGSASIPLQEGESKAAAVLAYVQKYLSPPEYWITPYIPWQPPTAVDAMKDKFTVSLPPLLKGYLRAGAWICSPQPAYDDVFNTADLFVLLPMSNVTQRHARHFIERN